MRRLFNQRLAPLGLLVACLLGCFASEHSPHNRAQSTWTIVDRFIEEDPEVLLRREDFLRRTPVFDWQFDAASSLDGWQGEDLRSAWERNRWRLQVIGEAPKLTRTIPPSADAMAPRIVEVTVSGLTGGLTLYWAAEGEGFSQRRSLTRQVGVQKRGKRVTLTYRFNELGAEPWQRIQLRPDTPWDDEIRLLELSGWHLDVDPEGLAQTHRQAVKVDLGADVRNAVLALPGLGWERPLVEGAERFRAAYGLDTTTDQAVTFQVVVEQDGERQVAFEDRLVPSSEGGRWHEVDLDLRPLLRSGAGKTTLHLSSESQNPLDVARGLAFWAHPESLAPVTGEPPPNVILISIDTLRADHLSAYGHRRQTSPHLDAWAADSAVLFKNVVAQAPWTIPSHASLFSGLDALRHGVNHAEAVPPGLELLPETLRRAGYSTAAITGGGYFRPQFGFVQGFDVYRYWPKVGTDEQLQHNSDLLKDWLAEQQARPFFLFFHTYEVHWPYRRREPYFSRLRDADPDDVEPLGEIINRRGRWLDRPRWTPDRFAVETAKGERREALSEGEKAYLELLYDSSIAYVDRHLERLLQHLDALDLRRKTVIIFTSDHGEALGEGGLAGHHYLDDFNVLIPLLIEFPDRRGAGTVVEPQVRSIDIVPTLLDFLDLDDGLTKALAASVDGVSLLPLLDGDIRGLPSEAWSYAATKNYGVSLRYRNRWKYTFNNSAWAELAGEEELLELSSTFGEAPRPMDDVGKLASLRLTTERALASQHVGLRLRLNNPSEGRLEGFLTGRWSAVERVKVADASCRCVFWKNRRAKFSLAPGQSVTLLFDAIPPGILGVEGVFKRPDGSKELFRRDFDRAALNGGSGGAAQRLMFSESDGAWKLVSGESIEGGVAADVDEAVGFVLWRVGDAELTTDLPGIDREAEEQLRALGYLQ